MEGRAARTCGLVLGSTLLTLQLVALAATALLHHRAGERAVQKWIVPKLHPRPHWKLFRGTVRCLTKLYLLLVTVGVAGETDAGGAGLPADAPPSHDLPAGGHRQETQVCCTAPHRTALDCRWLLLPPLVVWLPVMVAGLASPVFCLLTVPPPASLLCLPVTLFTIAILFPAWYCALITFSYLSCSTRQTCQDIDRKRDLLFQYFYT